MGNFFRFFGGIFHRCHLVILAICSTFLFGSFDSAAALLEKPTQSAWFEYFSYFRQPLKAGVMFMSDIQQVKPAALHGTQQQAIFCLGNILANLLLFLVKSLVYFFDSDKTVWSAQHSLSKTVRYYINPLLHDKPNPFFFFTRAILEEMHPGRVVVVPYNSPIQYHLIYSDSEQINE